jgi:hypothetical protein
LNLNLDKTTFLLSLVLLNRESISNLEQILEITELDTDIQDVSTSKIPVFNFNLTKMIVEYNQIKVPEKISYFSKIWNNEPNILKNIFIWFGRPGREFRLKLIDGNWISHISNGNFDLFKNTILIKIPMEIHIGPVQLKLDTNNSKLRKMERNLEIYSNESISFEQVESKNNIIPFQIDNLIPEEKEIIDSYTQKYGISPYFSMQIFQPSENINKYLARELTIDVDLSDYKGTRLCCQGKAKACYICWNLAMFSMEVLVTLAMEFFGFDRKNIKIYFSGRRGFHIWFMDDVSFYWNEQSREVFFAYINLPIRDYDKFKQIYLPLFSLVEQKSLITLITLQTLWKKKNYHVKELDHLIEDTKERILMLWPIMDKPVTTKINHPIKAPFQIHSETKRYCVTIDDFSYNPYDE